MASAADPRSQCARRRTRSPARNFVRKEPDQLLQAALFYTPARQASVGQTKVATLTRWPTRSRQTRTGFDSDRAVPKGRAVYPTSVSAMRQSTARYRSRTDSPSGLGTSRNPTSRYRISTASARLLLRLLHLRRIACGRAERASRATAHGLCRAPHGLLSPVETPRCPVLEHHSQATCQRGLDGPLAKSGCCGRQASL